MHGKRTDVFTVRFGDMWKIMQKILSLYAEEYNHKYHFTGHLFEGRYVAQFQEQGVSERIIERNGISVRLNSISRMQEWNLVFHSTKKPVKDSVLL